MAQPEARVSSPPLAVESCTSEVHLASRRSQESVEVAGVVAEGDGEDAGEREVGWVTVELAGMLVLVLSAIARGAPT